MGKKRTRRTDLAIIHIAKKDLGMSEDEYRTMIHTISKGKTESAGDLSTGQRSDLLDHLRNLEKVVKKYPGRPHNMDGRSSRDRQLGKIEALLTIGGKSWAYGDALAKRICKVDKLTWVDGGDLYKIIAALRKQAQREGWNLDE